MPFFRHFVAPTAPRHHHSSELPFSLFVLYFSSSQQPMLLSVLLIDLIGDVGNNESALFVVIVAFVQTLV